MPNTPQVRTSRGDGSLFTRLYFGRSGSMVLACYGGAGLAAGRLTQGDKLRMIPRISQCLMPLSPALFGPVLVVCAGGCKATNSTGTAEPPATRKANSLRPRCAVPIRNCAGSIERSTSCWTTSHPPTVSRPSGACGNWPTSGATQSIQFLQTAFDKAAQTATIRMRLVPGGVLQGRCEIQIQLKSKTCAA